MPENGIQAETGGNRAPRRGAIAAIVAFVALFPGPAAASGPSAGGSVSLEGAVAAPGAYPIRAGERLSSLIERAGGYADNALLAGALLARASQPEIQRAALLALVGSAESRALARPGDAGTKRAFFDALRRLPPTGRTPVRLAHPRLLKGSPYDLPLEDGDRLFIPSGTPGVAVAGAVASPGAAPHPYSARAEADDYVRMSGGFAPVADRDRVLILKADGSVVRVPRGFVRWNAGRGRWEIGAFSADRPRVGPGDRIAVPRKASGVSWMKPDEMDSLREGIAAITGVVVEAP